jgi:hypothetical protein
MCPVCLATTGLYIAGGVSGGGVTTFLATKLLRKRPEPTVSTPSTETTTVRRPTIAAKPPVRSPVKGENDDRSQDWNA